MVLAGGGTGGHVYPALAVATALRQDVVASRPGEDLEAVYLGPAARGEADLVQRAGVPWRAVSAGPLRVSRPWAFVWGLLRLAWGSLQAYRTLGRFRPDAVFATGGYASVPAALAAWLRRRPLILYLPDVEPGWAVRLTARLARRVAVTVEASLARLPSGKGVVTGYPVREAFFGIDKAEARRKLDLEPDLKTLLVSGATAGAHSINQAVAGNLPRLLALAQVVHVSGAADHAWLLKVSERLPQGLRGRYHLHAYLHDEMPWAMGAADLAVMRAGASVLGELTATGLPAILVPYRYAGGHQRHNAFYLMSLGGAIVMEDSQLPQLYAMVRDLLGDETRLAEMAAALRSAARPQAARDIARLLREVAA